MIGLTCGPFEIGVMVVMAVAVDVEDVREVVGVRDECFCHETMHLEVLTLDANTAVAFSVEGSYFAESPADGIGGHTYGTKREDTHTGRKDTTIIGDVVGSVAFLPELVYFDVTSHTLSGLNHRRDDDRIVYQETKHYTRWRNQRVHYPLSCSTA